MNTHKPDQEALIRRALDAILNEDQAALSAVLREGLDAGVRFPDPQMAGDSTLLLECVRREYDAGAALLIEHLGSRLEAYPLERLMDGDMRSAFAVATRHQPLSAKQATQLFRQSMEYHAANGRLLPWCQLLIQGLRSEWLLDEEVRSDVLDAAVDLMSNPSGPNQDLLEAVLLLKRHDVFPDLSPCPSSKEWMFEEASEKMGASLRQDKGEHLYRPVFFDLLQALNLPETAFESALGSSPQGQAWMGAYRALTEHKQLEAKVPRPSSSKTAPRL